MYDPKTKLPFRFLPCPVLSSVIWIRLEKSRGTCQQESDQQVMDTLCVNVFYSG